MKIISTKNLYLCALSKINTNNNKNYLNGTKYILAKLISDKNTSKYLYKDIFTGTIYSNNNNKLDFSNEWFCYETKPVMINYKYLYIENAKQILISLNPSLFKETNSAKKTKLLLWKKQTFL